MFLYFMQMNHYFLTTQLADDVYYNITFEHFIVDFLHFERFFFFLTFFQLDIFWVKY